jgi:tRNA-modifying protein YgfZ
MLIDLPSPQVLDIVGEDAEAFAQAQFCNDLRELCEGQWQWNAWLSAQGRVRAWFHLLRLEDGRFRLILRGGSAVALRDALARYVLRSKVQFELRDAARLLGTDDKNSLLTATSAPPENWDVVQAQGVTALAMLGSAKRWMLIAERSRDDIEADASDAAIDRWRAADIQAGIADLSMGLEDKFLPGWLGLDAFGITSLRKGCYPGQEIIARLHFKGGNKRWLHRLAFSGAALPLPGTELRDENQLRGTLVTSAWIDPGRGAIALAVLDDIDDGARLRAPALDGEFKVLARINPVRISDHNH